MKTASTLNVFLVIRVNITAFREAIYGFIW